LLVAIKVVHVSDLSDMEGSEDQLGRLVVQYPDMPEVATLEVFPEELESLESAERFVRLEWTPPGERTAKVLTVSQAEFDRLAQGRDMKMLLEQAIAATKGMPAGGQEPPRRRRSSGRSKVNYATLEHAGEPHRGRITEAEKELVRGNLDKINKRLREAGVREIDPNDTTMKERYGL
jgi:hypothetical protein